MLLGGHLPSTSKPLGKELWVKNGRSPKTQWHSHSPRVSSPQPASKGPVPYVHSLKHHRKCPGAKVNDSPPWGGAKAWDTDHSWKGPWKTFGAHSWEDARGVHTGFVVSEAAWTQTAEQPRADSAGSCSCGARSMNLSPGDPGAQTKASF